MACFVILLIPYPWHCFYTLLFASICLKTEQPTKLPTKEP